MLARNRVPPCAASSRSAPRIAPSGSLSSPQSEPSWFCWDILVQSMIANGLACLALHRWICLANRVLPAPLSPMSSIVPSDAAACSAPLNKRRMTGLRDCRKMVSSASREIRASERILSVKRGRFEILSCSDLPQAFDRMRLRPKKRTPCFDCPF